jgi:hypothetical protein
MPKDDHNRFSSRHAKESALCEMRTEATEQITRDLKSVVRLKCGRAALPPPITEDRFPETQDFKT